MSMSSSGKILRRLKSSFIVSIFVSLSASTNLLLNRDAYDPIIYYLFTIAVSWLFRTASAEVLSIIALRLVGMPTPRFGSKGDCRCYGSAIDFDTTKMLGFVMLFHLVTFNWIPCNGVEAPEAVLDVEVMQLVE